MRNFARALAVAVGAISVLAGCSSPSATSPTPSAPSSELTQRAITAGNAAAGARVTLPTNITVGFLDVLASAEILQRFEDQNKAAMKVLGWKYITCDGQANPSQYQTCMASFLSAGVSAIITGAAEPSVITPQLQEAKAKGIPVINIVGAVSDPSGLLAAQLSPSSRESEMAAALDQYMFTMLTQRDKGKGTTISVTGFPVQAGELRVSQLTADLKTHPDVTVVSRGQQNFSDPIGYFRTYATATLQAHPTIDAFWDAASQAPVPVSQVVSQRFGQVAYPQRPLIVSFVDDQDELAVIRSGGADAIATYPIIVDSWVALDQLAQFFARKTTVNPNASDWAKTYGLDFGGAEVITKANLPPSGQYPAAKEDFQSFFKAKWAKEFGTSAS
jgi:ABC-type sugar transport system substrate-binding protein